MPNNVIYNITKDIDAYYHFGWGRGGMGENIKNINFITIIKLLFYTYIL